MDYGSIVNGWLPQGENPGWVQLDITTDEGTTKIYFHHSPDAEQSESMNYDPNDLVPTGERFRAYTVIDDLVAGKTEFTLNISVLRTSENVHDGGCFLPDREVPDLWPESDFILSGVMAPGDPSYCGEVYSQELAGDISGPSGVPDCYVDLYDFALMSQLWLECTDPNIVNCIQ